MALFTRNGEKRVGIEGSAWSAGVSQDGWRGGEA